MALRSRLAALLKKSRMEAKLTLRQVETQTGVSNAYLSQLENSRTKNPSPHVLLKLARAYAISYEDLMDAAGYSHSPRPSAGALRIAKLAATFDASEEAELGQFLDSLLARRERNT